MIRAKIRARENIYKRTELVAVIGPRDGSASPHSDLGSRRGGNGGGGGGGGGGGRLGLDDDEDPIEKTLTVKIIVTENINCDRPTSQACSCLRVRLFTCVSGRTDTPSYTGYAPTICRVEASRAELVTSGEHLEITPRVPLDREAREADESKYPLLHHHTKRRRVAPHTVEGRLYILDEDDSPPIRIREPHVDWFVGDNTDDLDDKLMVVDPDLTNHYVVMLVGNTHNLVTIESVTEFATAGYLCNTALEGQSNVTISATCTVLTPVIKIEDCCGGRGLENAPSQIHFSVVWQDRSLLPPYAAKQVVYNLTLTRPRNNDYRSELSPGSGGVGSGVVTWDQEGSDQDGGGQLHYEHSLLMMEIPPAELNVTITLPVAKYHRVGQLIHHNITHSHDATLPSSAHFMIGPESPSYGLGITLNMGILYVSDLRELRSGEVVVRRGNSSTIVTLTVEEGEAPKHIDPSCFSLSMSKDEDHFPSCAVHTYQVNCENSCGYSASQGRCKWRHNNERGIIQSTHYATCSPDLATCPNGVCDELEIKNQAICPQDCVDESWIRGQQVTLSKSGRGIVAGMSPCNCNFGGCQCFVNGDSPPPISPPPVTPAIVPKTGSQWECNSGCQVGLAMAVLLTIAVIVGWFLLCRRRALRKEKHKRGVISLGTLPSEDRPSMPYNETHDSLIHGVRASPRNDHHTPIPALNLTIDRKWEFPRSRLVIEQTLGEGEFGKVMKAKAQGIAGNLGYSTVAVKMLKSNSTPAELADLLSEYTLLKEVSHPNVVKLLGACTSKGGPIYIIIEYCQYGSLRNYLKRSRHAEFENRVGSGPGEANAADYNITPKDILSFAWQICKGMAYLTEMKLVHRDLAARNVLLASGRVCKISDFGLTRDVYEGDLYFKRSKGRVPVKWMALESLVDHVYTSKSDVWGFGVLLWELVTLGTPPYPGITPERLFSLLKAGYRMERPDNCSPELSIRHKITYKSLNPFISSVTQRIIHPPSITYLSHSPTHPPTPSYTHPPIHPPPLSHPPTRPTLQLPLILTHSSPTLTYSSHPLPPTHLPHLPTHSTQHPLSHPPTLTPSSPTLHPISHPLSYFPTLTPSSLPTPHRYDVMLQCWAEDPGRRPTFQALTDIFENMIQADVEYLELRSLIVTNRGYFDTLPDPPQQLLDAPPQFQDSPTQQQQQQQQQEGQQQQREPGIPTPPPPPPPLPPSSDVLQARHLGLPTLNLEEVHTPRSQGE
ncbi:hypothetical protein Pmani_010423 [Petrolisthes manimaculis]|uniref:Protein kinase domain-containing protein n=1 Tax=Petrolisthes manimaculis TaxID=1843537 RepID=A0AAE1UBZ9_9EUCA|nr:hypothetical protein Pmani_010423 [Petrolisthes manimaculis]